MLYHIGIAPAHHQQAAANLKQARVALLAALVPVAALDPTIVATLQVAQTHRRQAEGEATHPALLLVRARGSYHVLGLRTVLPLEDVVLIPKPALIQPVQILNIQRCVAMQVPAPVTTQKTIEMHFAVAKMPASGIPHRLIKYVVWAKRIIFAAANAAARRRSAWMKLQEPAAVLKTK